MTSKNEPSGLDKEAGAEHNEVSHLDLLVPEAKQAADAEHEMTLWEAIKTYPHAIGWSVLLSTTLIMEGL
jgi:SP family general alpha glucoside:H+ symporter-like MFS transporter